jgi:hypothetical protein
VDALLETLVSTVCFSGADEGYPRSDSYRYWVSRGLQNFSSIIEWLDDAAASDPRDENPGVAAFRSFSGV